MKPVTAFLIVFFSLSVFAEDHSEIEKPKMFPESNLRSKEKFLEKVRRPSSKPETQENTGNVRWVCADGDGRIVEGKLGETCAEVMANVKKPWARSPGEKTIMPLPAEAKGPFRCRKEVFDTSFCSP